MTYERGVEDYTLACGTGCGSIATTLWAKGQLPEGKLTCLNKGGTLQITIGETDGAIDAIFLEGPAQVLKIYEL